MQKHRDQAGDILPVEISVFSDKTFTFITKQPPVSRMILKELGIESGSKVPNRDKVGSINKSSSKENRREKMPDMRVRSSDAALRLVAGTARSMGVDIVEG